MPTVPLLSGKGLDALSAFATSNVLVAFDFDGTLAPITRTPKEASLPPATARLLADVARRYPLVVISGRALRDVRRRLHDIPVWYVFGNHGIEPEHKSPDTTVTRAWIGLLRRRLKASGVIIEDKRHTVTLHYRTAPDRERAQQAIREAVRALPDVRVIGGHEAVNLLPRDAANKGTALRDAVARFACDSAIYVGDDDTDEDAFSGLAAGRLLGIRVEPSDASKATYHLGSQAEINGLLRSLTRLRTRRVVGPPGIEPGTP